MCENDRYCVELRLEEHWARAQSNNWWGGGSMSTDGWVALGSALCCVVGARQCNMRRCRRRCRRACSCCCGWCAGQSSGETIKLYNK